MPEKRLERTRQNYKTRKEDLRCPDCGQPVNILVSGVYLVTDPQTGHTTIGRSPVRFCPAAFHFDPHEH